MSEGGPVTLQYSPVNADIPARQPSANCGIMHRNKQHPYSITSSARQ